MSRRTVLGAGVGTAALVVLGVDAGPADAAVVPVAPVRRHYARSVGKVFTATHAGRTHHLTLTAIRDAVPALAADKPHCFTLIFEPTGSGLLHEGIYRLRRRGVHTHSLFLSSVGQSGGLQAAVNRAVR